MTLMKGTFRNKFPVKTAVGYLVLAIVILVLLDIAFLNMVLITGFYNVVVLGIINFVVAAPFQFIAGAGLVIGILAAIKYRQKYGKKEVLIPTPAAPLQNTLAQTPNQMYPSLNTNTQELKLEEE